jgi:hypothetical protein
LRILLVIGAGWLVDDRAHGIPLAMVLWDCADASIVIRAQLRLFCNCFAIACNTLEHGSDEIRACLMSADRRKQWCNRSIEGRRVLTAIGRICHRKRGAVRAYWLMQFFTLAGLDAGQSRAAVIAPPSRKYKELGCTPTISTCDHRQKSLGIRRLIN